MTYNDIQIQHHPFTKGQPMKKITSKQLDVMQALWGADASMTASEIIRDHPELNINTVQSCLKQLLKKEYIRVADIVYSGTVLCRSYEPVVSRDSYVSEFFSGGGSMDAAAQFIGCAKDAQDLDKLQALIDKRRAELAE